MSWQLALKIFSGILIVPIAIVAHLAWPLWTKAPIPVRVLTGPLILPLAGIAAIVTPWWEKV